MPAVRRPDGTIIGEAPLGGNQLQGSSPAVQTPQDPQAAVAQIAQFLRPAAQGPMRVMPARPTPTITIGGLSPLANLFQMGNINAAPPPLPVNFAQLFQQSTNLGQTPASQLVGRLGMLSGSQAAGANLAGIVDSGNDPANLLMGYIFQQGDERRNKGDLGAGSANLLQGAGALPEGTLTGDKVNEYVNQQAQQIAHEIQRNVTKGQDINDATDKAFDKVKPQQEVLQEFSRRYRQGENDYQKQVEELSKQNPGLGKQALGLPGKAVGLGLKGLQQADVLANFLVNNTFGPIEGPKTWHDTEQALKNGDPSILNAFGGAGELLQGAGGLGKLGKTASIAEQAGTSLTPFEKFAATTSNAKSATLSGTGKALSTATEPLRAAGGAFVPQTIKTATQAGRELNTVDRVFGSVRGNLERMGAPGQAIAKLLQGARDTYETQLSTWVQKVPTISKLKGAEQENFAMSAQGLAKPMNTKVAQAVTEWTALRPQVLAWARKSGVDAGEIENYFPRYFDKKFLNSSAFDRTAEKLVNSGAAKDLAEAKDLITRQRSEAGVVRNRKSAIEFSRTGSIDTGYRTDKNVVLDYLSDVAKRGSEVAQYDVGDNAVLNLINQLPRARQKDAQHLFDTAVSAVQRSENALKFSAGARSFNAATKLGLGAITNAQQILNTVARTGVVNTAKAVAQYSAEGIARRFGLQSTQEAHQFAKDTGTVIESVLRSLKESAGFSSEGRVGEIAGKIGAPLFNPVERFNRSIAANAGRMYAEQLAARGGEQAIRQLNELGLDGAKIVKAGTLTKDEQITAARKIVEWTQFKVDPQDLPAWASSPFGKMVAQFRTFGYNQTKFVGGLLKEAQRGNPAPLVRWALLGTPVGYGASQATDFLRHKAFGQEAYPKNALDYFTKSGGLGLPTDVVQQVDFAAHQSSKDKQLASLASLFGGPTIGTAAQGIDAGLNGPQASEKFGIKQIPVAGPTLAAAAFPYTPKDKTLNVPNAVANITPKAAADQLVSQTPSDQLEFFKMAKDDQLEAARTDPAKAALFQQEALYDIAKKRADGKRMTEIDVFNKLLAAQKSQTQAGFSAETIDFSSLSKANKANFLQNYTGDKQALVSAATNYKSALKTLGLPGGSSSGSSGGSRKAKKGRKAKKPKLTIKVGKPKKISAKKPSLAKVKPPTTPNLKKLFPHLFT